MNSNFNSSQIIEFFKTPRGRGLIFLGFYAILFIFLFASIDNGESDSGIIPVKDLRINKIIESFNQIEANNYQYSYTINENSTHIIKGKRYNNKEVFTVTTDGTVEEYQYDGIFMAKHEGSNYYSVPSIYINKEFFDIKGIKMILKNSAFYAETKYNDNKVTYNYEISLNELMGLLGDDSNGDGKITMKIDVDLNVTNRIELDITSYAKFYDDSINKYLIELVYSDYGEVQNFELNGVTE